MLASITPLGERGRRSPWLVTVAAFLLGAVAGGAVVGALAGELGGLLLPGTVASDPRAAIIAAAAVGALILDRMGRVPGPNRQVNERWLEEYRGWVYGLGYGSQLGAGVLTVVTSAATYAMLAAALLAGGPARGASVVAAYGLLRGLTPLAAAGVRAPGSLLTLHRRLARWREPVARAGALALVAVAAAGVAESLL